MTSSLQELLVCIKYIEWLQTRLRVEMLALIRARSAADADQAVCRLVKAGMVGGPVYSIDNASTYMGFGFLVDLAGNLV